MTFSAFQGDILLQNLKALIDDQHDSEADYYSSAHVEGYTFGDHFLLARFRVIGCLNDYFDSFWNDHNDGSSDEHSSAEY